MITAKWMPGFDGLFKGADAQRVAEEIMSIGESATPQQILDKARNESSELHRCFTWDDSIAAEQYRLVEARKIVRMLIIQRADNENSAPIRFFMKTDASLDSGYKATTVIFRNEDETAALLAKAKADAKSWSIRYQTLREYAELTAVFDAVDALE